MPRFGFVQKCPRKREGCSWTLSIRCVYHKSVKFSISVRDAPPPGHLRMALSAARRMSGSHEPSIDGNARVDGGHAQSSCVDVVFVVCSDAQISSSALNGLDWHHIPARLRVRNGSGPGKHQERVLLRELRQAGGDQRSGVGRGVGPRQHRGPFGRGTFWTPGRWSPASPRIAS